jgi:hypothetical protein
MRPYAVLLAFLIYSPTAQSGWGEPFWCKHIIADYPYEAEDTIEEMKDLYPDPKDYKEELLRLYHSELRKENRDMKLIRLIQIELSR